MARMHTLPSTPVSISRSGAADVPRNALAPATGWAAVLVVGAWSARSRALRWDQTAWLIWLAAPVYCRVCLPLVLVVTALLLERMIR